VEISDDVVAAAEARMQARLASGPVAISARYDRRVSRIVIGLSNGLELAFAPALAEGLRGAKPADLSVIEISPAGLGLHWPALDADLYLPSLLEGVFGSPRWMAALAAHPTALFRNSAPPAAVRKTSAKHSKKTAAE
jgi:hypothetical protein